LGVASGADAVSAWERAEVIGDAPADAEEKAEATPDVSEGSVEAAPARRARRRKEA
jgi:hypothetical protein